MILQFYFSSVQSFSILCQALTRSVKHFSLVSAKSTLWIFTMYGLKRNTRAEKKGIKVLRGRWRYRCMLLVMWKRSSSDALMEAVVNELMPGLCQFNLDDYYARFPSACAKNRIYSRLHDNDSSRHDFAAFFPSWHKLRQEISLSATEKVFIMSTPTAYAFI